MRNRLTLVAGVTTAAAVLSACSSYPGNGLGQADPNPPVSQAPVYSAPAPVATYPSGTVVQSAPVAAVEFGRVTDIQQVAQGQTSATNPSARNAVVGGVIGAVVGNVLGKNVNNGHNRSGATVLGAAGGAAIGNGIGQRQEQQQQQAAAANGAYRVTVQTDQGQWRTFEVGALGDLRVGDRVRVENGVIYRS
ncbi:glycine zipper 2TM domain-containing protein [Ramlibacter humi]|nr:glycine zipper domain-containing protein [Ramlibacter humi]